jgi:stage II sporulation protein D
MLIAVLLMVHLPHATAPMTSAQSLPTEAELDEISRRRMVTLGTPSTGRIIAVPLEAYVARVLTGEAEPSAPAAAQQAIAMAIRTYAIVNARRHTRDGYGLCDTTHCQVPRASTPTTRQAALATAGRILLFEGAPAAVFYSANCGGRSETASEVWPGAHYPYLRSVGDDVHADDVPWTLELSLERIRTALVPAGFSGERLNGIAIDARNDSGRVNRIRLDGLRPGSIAGDAFRMAIGPAALRSTAFSFDTDRDVVRFTGRGYGHGVGMCVVGAARRARRGENAADILQAYFPGLTQASLDDPAVAASVTGLAVLRAARP